MDNARLREDLNVRWQAMKEERSPWMNVWRDISDYVCPHLGRFSAPTDTNDGERNDGYIVDDSARIAHRNFCSGMQSGLTSPARPWFKLNTPGDPERSEYPPLRAWLDHCGSVLLRIFAKSNAYSAFLSTYAETGSFGCHAYLIERDFDSVIRLKPFTVGEYALATDDRNRVNTLGRNFSMTAVQMIGAFGLENVSSSVKDAYDRGNTRARFEVVHMMLPNQWKEHGKKDSKNMPTLSAYWDPSDQSGKMLRNSGYKGFRAITPRWSVVSDDVYSKGSPGWFALGNVKMIQQLQSDCLEGIQKAIDPPVQAPAALQFQSGLTTVPGGVNYVPDTSAGGVRSIYDIRPDIEAIERKIQTVSVNIERTFFSDLFLMLTNINRSGVTATEVAERHEEKLLMLGPVLEQLYSEMLDPTIDIAFEYALEAGILPPPPPDLQGQEIRAEYVSVLAQAQRMVGTAAIEQTMAFAGNLIGAFPEVRHQVNAMMALQKYGTYVGVPSEILRPEEEAMERWNAEMQQVQQQKAMEQMGQAAGAGKVLADTQVGQNSALDMLLGGMGGTGT